MIKVFKGFPLDAETVFVTDDTVIAGLECSLLGHYKRPFSIHVYLLKRKRELFPCIKSDSERGYHHGGSSNASSLCTAKTKSSFSIRCRAISQ